MPYTASHGRVAVCIADVEGKGLPAAMLRSNLQASVRALVREPIKPHELCERLNRAMLQNSAGLKLIPLFYAVVDVRRGTLSYANAGHHAPMLVGRDGRCRRLLAGGPPLHLFAESAYETGEVELRSGDLLLMFTDGVVECGDASGEEFGETELLRLLREQRDLGADALPQAVKAAITDFSGGDLQDDVTMIALRYS